MINIVDKCCEKASKGAFLHFLFALIKIHKFPVAKAKQEPTPAIFSSSESEIAPSENFSENHEEEKSFSDKNRHMGGITY